jgi:group I intron endonuclease
MATSHYGVVYEVKNLVTGNTYVGQTKTKLADRWGKHKSDARRGKVTPLCHALRKHGESAFSVEVVALCIDKDALNAAEIYYIRELRPDYNCSSGGGGLGSPSPEVRDKISKSLKGRQFSAVTRERISRGLIGRALSPESRLKLSATLKTLAKEKALIRGPKPKKKRPPHVSPNEEFFVKCGASSTRDKISAVARKQYADGSRKPLVGPDNPSFGKPRSKEVKAHLSEVFAGELNPFYGKQHTDETKAKMSAAHALREKVVCPNCGKSGIVSNMKRWHLDNCRNKGK